jgi:hypothetical protein
MNLPKGLAWSWAAALMTMNVALAQGEFYFNNRISSDGVNARFVLSTDPAGTSSVGTDFQVQLFGGPKGSLPDQFQALDPPGTGFRGPAGSAIAGYVTPVVARVPNVPPFQTAAIVVRVFDGGSWQGARYRFEGL